MAETIMITTEFLKGLGLALMILVVSFVTAKMLRRGVQRFATRKQLPVDMTNLLLQISEVGIFLFGAVSALGTLGIDIGALIAGLGLVGFAFGFALKDLLSNFLSGLLILIYSPFLRGDTITVSGTSGTVVEVNMRYTVLQAEGKKILIPNSLIFSNIVTLDRKSA